MKLSSLIKKLNEYKKLYGDFDVFVPEVNKYFQYVELSTIELDMEKEKIFLTNLFSQFQKQALNEFMENK